MKGKSAFPADSKIMTSLKDKKIKQILLSLATILIWSSGYVCVRISLKSFTPDALSFIRYVFSSIALVFLIPFFKVKLPEKKDIPYFILAGASGYGLFTYFVTLGSQTVTASVSSFVVGISPVITPLLAFFILKEKISFIKWFSVLFAGVGVFIMLFTDKTFSIDIGVIWVLISAFLFSVFNIVQRILLKKYTPFELTTYAIFIGTLMLAVFSKGAVEQVMSSPIEAMIPVIYLGVSSSLSYVLWSAALKLAEYTSEVTNFMFLTPIFTTILGFVSINELPPFTAYIGGVFMMIGVVMVSFDSPKKKKEETDM